MSDETVMGIAATRQRWGESRLFSRIRRSTRLRATRATDPIRAQTLRSPSQGDASRSASIEPAAPGPRSRASVPDALRLLLGVLAGGHGVATRSGLPQAAQTRRRP